MLRRSALTWTDGGAGFALSDRAAFRVGGEESPAGSPRTPAPQHTHTHTAVVLFSVPDSVQWYCCILSDPQGC